MAFVAERFAANVAATGTATTAVEIEQAALPVVLYWISTFNLWRAFYKEHRDHALSVTQSELDAPATFDRVRRYCQDAFGVDYARHASALLGVSVEDFARREEQRERLSNM